jgi:hypothetical protein
VQRPPAAEAVRRHYAPHPLRRFLVQEAIEYLCERGDEAERVVEEMEGQFSNFLAWAKSRD